MTLQLDEGEKMLAAIPLVHILKEVTADKKHSRCSCGYEGTNGEVFYHVVRKAVEGIAP